MAKYDAMGDKVNRRVPIALWIMLLGVVVAAAGFIWCLNTDLKKYAKTEDLYTDQTVDDIKDLKFDLGNAETEITQSSDDKIHVTIKNAPENSLTFGKQGSKFYVKRKKSFQFFMWSGISSIPFLKDVYPEAKIRIEIPQKDFDRVEIDNGVGNTKIVDISCDYLNIENGVGELTLHDCKANKANIENGIGELSINSCDFGNTDIENGIGSITVKSEINGDIDIENGIGEIDLKIKGNSEDYRFSGDDDDVSIKGKLGGSGAKYKIKADNGLGDIDISFID